MSKKILTLTEQRHIWSTLSETFSGLTQQEKYDIIKALGLDGLIGEDGSYIPFYSMDIHSSRPTYITNQFDTKLTANLYNYTEDVSSDVTEWKWERVSGNKEEDKRWAVGKNTRELDLTHIDFTERFTVEQDITFKVSATIKGKTVTDEIIFSKILYFSKVQIVSDKNVFIESTPEKIRLSFTTDITVDSIRWYIDNRFLSASETFGLGYNLIPLGGSATIKLEVVEEVTGKVFTDSLTIPRISNGTDGEPGVPGAPGSNSYTWIKYADGPNGTNMSEYPIDERTGIPREYIGMAPNKDTPVESNNPADYTWTKYIGSDGVPGESVLTSIVFKRSADTPAIPTGGSYLNPVPKGWSDGIPDVIEDFPVWMSTRVFTLSGNAPQEFEWSEPQITSDTATIDFDWSSSDVVNPGTPDNPLNGAIWEEISSTSSIWMAIQRTVNGEKKPWEIKKIKGEKGEPSYMWLKYSLYSNGRDPSGDVEMFDTPFIIKLDGEREDMVYMGIAYNKQVQQEADPNTPEGAPEQYVWSKIKGEDGRTPYTLDLSNDNVSVPANSSGTTGSTAFNLAKTDITLYYGNDVIDPSEYTLSFIPTNVTYVLSNNNHHLQITGMTGSTGEVKIEARANNKLLTTATFSVVKIVGTATYEILPSTSVIKIVNNYTGGDQEVQPTSIDVKIKKNTGESVDTVYEGRLTYRYIYTSSVGTDDDGINIPIDQILEIDNSGNPLFLEFKYFHPITNAMVDRETIPFVRDGVSANTTELRFRVTNTSTIIPSLDKSNPNPPDWTVTQPTVPSGHVLWMTRAVKKANGDLIGQWSDPIIFIGMPGAPGNDGPPGPPGISGTTGPSPRTFEWLPGAQYQVGEGFIDYAYYRGTGAGDPCLGWYVVKLDPGKTIANYNTTAKKVIANASGCPDPNLFVRAPFSESMTFSTIIAEQANLAGFLFRNQVLYSQTGAKTSSCHPTPNTQLANLSLDGFNGVIRFLDRMVLDSSGITLKDNCGKPRMQFQWTLEGTPRLRFLNENGETTWEAGNNGYVAYFQSRPTTYTEITGSFINGVSVDTTPTATQIKNGVGLGIIGNIVCKCGSNYNGFSTYAANNPPTIGYFLSAGTPDVATQNEINNNGKIFKDRDIPSGLVDTGWYLIDIKTYYGSSPDTRAVVSLLKVNNGSGQNIDIIIDDFRELGTIYPCGIHGTPQC